MPKKPTRQAEPWTFVFPDERELPAEQQSVFTLTPLTIDERMRAQDERQRFVARGATPVTEMRTAQWALGIALGHIESAENTPNDAPVKWPGLDAPLEARRKWIDENLDDTDVMLLGLEIYERSRFGAPEGNS